MLFNYVEATLIGHTEGKLKPYLYMAESAETALLVTLWPEMLASSHGW